MAAEKLEIITHASEVLTALCIAYPPCKSYELNIKNKKYFVIDFNQMSKKPLKKIVSSQNAKRLSQSEIEKIIRFGINNNDL